jgi:hypothetical protein
MKLITQIFILVLCMYTGIVSGMEKDTLKPRIIRQFRNSSNQAYLLAYCAREASLDENDLEPIVSVGSWLTYKRKTILEEDAWTIFVNRFIDKMEESYCKCFCIRNKKLEAAINIIIAHLYDIDINTDCAKLLMNHIKPAIVKLVLYDSNPFRNALSGIQKK